MKKLTIIFLFICSYINAQTKIDSVKVKSSWYSRTMPYAIYTGPGYQIDRVSQNIEFGRSYGPVDIGLAFGRISLRPDSTMYLQGRITMDACQYGIFSNEYAIGAGCVFNSNTPIMLEVSTTILAQVGKKIGVGVMTGYYDFSGNINSSNKNYYGIFLRWGLIRNNNGILLNRGMHHHGR